MGYSLSSRRARLNCSEKVNRSMRYAAYMVDTRLQFIVAAPFERGSVFSASDCIGDEVDARDQHVE